MSAIKLLLFFLVSLSGIAQDMPLKVVKKALLTVWVFEQNPVKCIGKPYEYFESIPLKKRRFLLAKQLNPKKVWGCLKSDGRYYLENRHFKIVDKSRPYVDPVSATKPEFKMMPYENGFTQVNAFYHLNNIKSYFGYLGCEKPTTQLEIDAEALGVTDASKYVGGSRLFLFGVIGVKDAENPEIIIHEYFHSLVYAIAYNSNVGTERKCIEEGLADYLAASYNYQTNPRCDWKTLFDWTNNPKDMVRAYGDKNYQKLSFGMFDDPYLNRDLWSSIFLEIMEKIGKKATDKILLRSIEGMRSNISMPEFANDIIAQEIHKNNGKYTDLLMKVFKKHGIPIKSN